MAFEPPEVRPVTAADVPALARMLARSFDDDPVSVWTCRPDALRAAVLERFNAQRLRQMLRHDTVWTTPALDSVAIWAPPQRWRSTVAEDLEIARSLLRLRTLAHPLALARAPLVGAGLLDVERQHPREPSHWYLAILGTDPPAQGRGLASAVLGPVLRACDEDEVGAYLESSKERNIGFYARHGFQVVGEIHLPLGGPTMWRMWREPRGRPAPSGL